MFKLQTARPHYNIQVIQSTILKSSQASSLKVGAELAQDPLHILVQVILIQMSTVPILLPQPCFPSLSFPEATGAARLRRRGGRWRKQERIGWRWRRGRCPESECGGDCAKYEIVHMKGAHCKWGWRLNLRFAVLFTKLWSSDFLSHLTPVVRRKGMADQLSSWLTLQTHPQHLLPAVVKVSCSSAGIADKVPENRESIPVAIHQGVGRVDSTLLAAVVAMLAEHFQANLQKVESQSHSGNWKVTVNSCFSMQSWDVRFSYAQCMVYTKHIMQILNAK